MECPNCSYNNPADARFCQNCGGSLQSACPNCGMPNAPNARFCKQCGTSLAPAGRQADGPADPSRARLRQYMPQELVDKLEAARAGHAMGGERRVVTILFCDVVGSTALAGNLDPEEWAEIMNGAFEFLIAPVYRYEGTVARLMGDAILALFGAPLAHEDDPQRAVLAALDIVAGTRDYAEKLKRERGLEFSVRVGINTGLVAVGEVGAWSSIEYTAMGDAANLAARLQSAARPMSVLVSENTYHFIAPVFEGVDLGTIEVKGKAEPVHVYEVLGRKAEPGPLRGLAGLASPIVGRDAELAALLRLSDAVRAGLGRAALVVGEPGLGKSRLVSEWKSRVTSTEGGAAGLPPTRLEWAEGQSLSYGQGLAYHLVLDLLRSLINVPAAAEEAQVRSALHDLTTDLFGPAALGVYPYLGHLLALQLEDESLERVRLLDPQALQDYYVTALEQLLGALAARHPLVLVLEDIHWADPSSVEILGRLLLLVREAPLLFCFTTRPDRDAPGWKLVVGAREALGAGLSELVLSPLSDADSRQLVTHLLQVESLPERIRAVILEKAEGNPFFVEEVIRMLIDRSAIVRQGESWVAGKGMEAVDIPSTLHGLLLARIDRLPEELKHTLRIASVIGRQFPVRVLEQVLLREGIQIT